MADYSPDAFIDNSGPPYVGQTALNKLGNGIADAASHHKRYASFAAMPAPAAANKNWLAFTDTGGVYLSDGTSWTLVAGRGEARRISQAAGELVQYTGSFGEFPSPYQAWYRPVPGGIELEGLVNASAAYSFGAASGRPIKIVGRQLRGTVAGAAERRYSLSRFNGGAQNYGIDLYRTFNSGSDVLLEGLLTLGGPGADGTVNSWISLSDIGFIPLV